MEGVITAIVTPFCEDGTIDKQAFVQLISMQEDAGINGIVIGGTTGEGWSLSDDEIEILYKICRKHFSSKVCIATGSISTKQSVQKTLFAKNLGADSCLVIVPYYNLPSEDGIVDHFKKVADVGLGVIVYHHPKRTGVTLSVKCLKRICSIDGVVGLKETHYHGEEIALLSMVTTVYCGNDEQIKEMQNFDAKGVISVVSNLLPVKTMEFFVEKRAKKRGDFLNFLKKLMEKGNPIGIKAALFEKNICKNIVREPLKCLSGKELELYTNNLKQTMGKEFANI